MLERFPVDVFIEISHNLTLADLLSFISVCSPLRRLASTSKYLWVSILERTRIDRPIACCTGTDLSQLDIPDLQRIGWLTHKVQTNWSKPDPQFQRTISSLRLFNPPSRPSERDGQDVQQVVDFFFTSLPANDTRRYVILHAIPATNLVILYNIETEELEVCNALGTIPPVTLSLKNLSLGRSHFDKYGCHVFAVTTEHQSTLQVLFAEYDPHMTRLPELKLMYSWNIPPHWQMEIRATFLLRDIVVFVLADGSDSLGAVYAIAYNSGLFFRMSFPPDIPDKINFVSFHVAKHSAYLICSVGSLPSVRSHVVFHLDIPPVGDSQWKQWDPDNIPSNCQADSITGHVTDAVELTFDLDLPRMPEADIVEQNYTQRGIHIIGIKYLTQWMGEAFAYFWPIEKLQTLVHPSAQDIQDTSGLVTLLDGRILECRDFLTPLFVTSPSGNYSVTIEAGYAESSRRSRLLLIQWHSNRGALKRILEVPWYIVLEEIFHIGLDESCGLVYLLHERGHLFTLPYA